MRAGRLADARSFEKIFFEKGLAAAWKGFLQQKSRHHEFIFGDDELVSGKCETRAGSLIWGEIGTEVAPEG